MVIQYLIKWINQNFSECISTTKRNGMKCDTLFIDAFQFYFNMLLKSRSDDEFVRKYLASIKNSILSCNPDQTIFIFLDGPSPAIKFQKLRERWFKNCHIEGFEISQEYEDEEEEEEEESNLENAHNALENYIKRLINYDNVNAKSIVYSSLSVPGEAKYKYFDYFRQMKSDVEYSPNWINFIMSDTNEMLFLALQFINDRFFIIKSNHTTCDIEILRNLILYHMTLEDPFPGTSKSQQFEAEYLKKRKSIYKTVVSKMSNQLKQQIINDVIALSIVISSENFAPFPEIKRMGTTAYTFSKVLNSYKELNQPFIASQIKMGTNNKKTDKSLEFTPLIVDNCFCLESLQKIMRKFIQMYVINKSNVNIRNSKNIKNDDSDSVLENQINHNDEDKKELHSHSKIKMKSHANSKKEDVNVFDVGIFSYDNDQEYEYEYESNINEKIDNNENNNDTDIEKYDDDDDVTNNVDDYQEESQQLFRLFNFTWQLYSNSCPSWSFYYQFKHSPPLDIALDLMQQEGLEVFDTDDANDVPDPTFKCFIIYPVEEKEAIPHFLYKLKIPPSPIAQYWPLGATNPKDIPILDLKQVKKYYNEAISKKGCSQKTITKTNQIIFKTRKRNKQKRSYPSYIGHRVPKGNPFDI